VVLDTSVESAFAHLDDFHRLSGHMEKSSGMMLGSKMSIDTDERGGRKVGSVVRMRGTVMGMALSLEERVTHREPPLRKAWETVDSRLVIIGQYRLGFELSPEAGTTRLRVFIDYALPERVPARWLGRIFGGIYARWCTDRMAADAVKAFRRAG
jgi:hypothetical protein